MSNDALLLLLAKIHEALINANPIDANALLTLLETVDGAGSGLDADLLDGEEKLITDLLTLTGNETPDTFPIGVSGGRNQAAAGGFPNTYGIAHTIKWHANRVGQFWFKPGQNALWFRQCESGGTAWRAWQKLTPPSPWQTGSMSRVEFYEKLAVGATPVLLRNAYFASGMATSIRTFGGTEGGAITFALSKYSPTEVSISPNSTISIDSNGDIKVAGISSFDHNISVLMLSADIG